MKWLKHRNEKVFCNKIKTLQEKLLFQTGELHLHRVSRQIF